MYVWTDIRKYRVGVTHYRILLLTVINNLKKNKIKADLVLSEIFLLCL